MTKTELHRLVDALPDDAVTCLSRDGSVTLTVVRDGERLIVHAIDPEQAWFWTPEWQAKEREADEDIAAGRGTIYSSDDEFLAALEADLKPLP